MSATPGLNPAPGRGEPRSLIPTGCPAMVRMAWEGNEWVAKKVISEHNHGQTFQEEGAPTRAEMGELRAELVEDRASLESIILNRERRGLKCSREKMRRLLKPDQQKIKLAGSGTATFCDTVTKDAGVCLRELLAQRWPALDH